jgi:uncharacterized protein YkwD
MRRCLYLALLPLAPLLAGAGGGPNGKKGEPAFALTADEKKYFDLTNAERVKNGLPPLKLNLTLSKVARAHSENMVRQGKMVHKLDGKDQFARIKGAGYRYRYAGENLARGNVEPAEIVASLMKSPGHRANILKKEYTELGVGLAPAPEERTYYTQVFATPKMPKSAP